MSMCSYERRYHGYPREPALPERRHPGACLLYTSDGLLNAKIKTSGKVDTSKPGTYKVTYRVSDSSGHTAKAVRTVHVVESMETMQDGVPVLMYHYVYDPANPPADLNGNFIASTAFEQQLSHLKENDFYFPSYPEMCIRDRNRHTLMPNDQVVIANMWPESRYLLPLSVISQCTPTPKTIMRAVEANSAKRCV